MRIKPNLKRDIKTRLQMSRDSHGFFRLQIEDEGTSLTILDIKMDAEALAALVSTQYTQPVDAEYYHNDQIGKKMVVYTGRFTVSKAGKDLFKDYDKRDQDMKVLLAYAEKFMKKETGHEWYADNDSYNYKRVSGEAGKATYELTLRRYE